MIHWHDNSHKWHGDTDETCVISLYSSGPFHSYNWQQKKTRLSDIYHLVI